MKHDSFDRIFNVAFPVLMILGFILALGAIAVVDHFVLKFW